MQVTIKELLIEIENYLFTPREIVITTNLAMIILVMLCLGYMIFATGKYLNWNNKKKPKKKTYSHNEYNENKDHEWWVKYNKDAYGPHNKPDNEPKWYPTGWFWDEIDCCWKPPEYRDKQK